MSGVQSIRPCLIATLIVVSLHSTFANGAVLFQENWDSLTLGPVVTFPSEVAERNVWTKTAPAGWVSDSSLVPGDPINEGVQEFRGWTFVDKDWWIRTSGDQERSSFTRGYGIVAQADPDEFDDFSLGSGEGRGPAPDGCFGSAEGCYDASLTTPSISLGGAAPNTARVVFDSSWRDEDTQRAALSVSFNNGPYVDLFSWSSNPSDPNFHDDAPNEIIDIPVNNPAGATSMRLKFRLFDAGNDWWWGVDNLQVYTNTPGPRDPALKTVVDRTTGNVKIVNGTNAAVSLRGYSILSDDGTFDETEAAFQADGSSNWVQLTLPGAGTDLSEGHLTSVTIPSGGELNLGNGSWDKYYKDQLDISFQYLVAGKTTPVPGLVEFVGNGGESYPFLDLNFDNAINLNDWLSFLAVTDQADLTNLTKARAYRKGDLDGNGRLGVNDFIVFQREFDRVNGAGSFAAMAGNVPEPSSLSLVALLAASLLGNRRRSVS